jgi:hypothetical protein
MIMRLGRPPLDIAEKLRRRIWYTHVIQRSSMSHYLMDSVFDINPEGKPNNSKKKDSRRVRIFDAIRDRDWMPFRDHLDDFIKTVDEYQTKENLTPLKGTADLFYSRFWTLMKPAEMNLLEIREFLVECMKGLAMLNFSANQKDTEKPILDYFASRKSRSDIDPMKFHIGLYEYLLGEVITPIPDSLDKLALLGAMLREAYYAGRLDFCLLLNQSYNKTLDNVTNSDLIPNQHKADFWTLATQRILGSFFQKKGQEVKSYFRMINNPSVMGSPAGLILVEHDLAFWTKGGIDTAMQERINAGEQKVNHITVDKKLVVKPQKVEQWINTQTKKRTQKDD